METWPYEQLSHAVLAWLEQHKASCDVLHVHEWGGMAVDIITANHYRQIKDGMRPSPCEVLQVHERGCMADWAVDIIMTNRGAGGAL